ncbi:MAG TPA: acyl-CoA carboxylase subunit beta, partial [Nannocystaceae bacterium]|nr:acyl-CoA carboxylase subunit beta [Nannocystaceae bacterium]
MPVIESRFGKSSEGFAKNRDEMLALVEHFRGLEGKVREHSARQAGKFSKRGQLLPRDRIARLLDRGAPWL